MSQSKMALKPYLEAIDDHCDQLSKDDLKNMIINIAKEVAVGERKIFLSKLYSFCAAKQAVPDEADEIDETNIRKALFNQIDALKEEIQERVSSIEDGSYWDMRDYDDYYDYNEEPDYISEDQIDELKALFNTADDYFFNDHLILTRDLYEKLFQLIDEFDGFDSYEYGYPLSSDTFFIKEYRARYCRCVYETSHKPNRVQDMINAMNIHAALNPKILDLKNEQYPMFQDIIDARPGTMEEWDNFLNQFCSELKKHKTNRSEMLLIEISFIQNGMTGIAKLARQWKTKQPRGYLFWIQRLIEEEDWKVASDICMEALNIFPNTSFREQAAEHLIQCAKKLDCKDVILTAKREKFISSPDKENLLNLAHEAFEQHVRNEEMSNLMNRYQKSRKNFSNDSLYIKFLLMAGNLKAAFELIKTEKTIEWHSDKAGIVFVSILYVICEKPDSVKIIHQLFKYYANTVRASSSFHIDEDKEATSMYKEIRIGLGQYALKSADKTVFWEWAYEIGCGQIDSIVSNKERNAYGRAAQMLGALSECLILTDQKDKAQHLVNTYYKEKYRRFSAFRREVKAVFNHDILKSIEI
ncbi:MAG: hypothetical protein HQK75_10600 [Candidatus Magnetomorum sp.]|nr:hypothetical protein [Candidatus Magnetomorum sp.]